MGSVILISFFFLFFHLISCNRSISLTKSHVSLILASKFGFTLNENANQPEWSTNPQPPNFMLRLYNKVIDKTEQDPTKAMNLLGFGNDKIFANSMQILYSIFNKRGNFGKKSELLTFNFNISLLNDTYSSGYFNMRTSGIIQTDIHSLTILVISKGTVSTLFTNVKILTGRVHVIPLSKISRIIQDGILSFMILVPKDMVFSITATLILYTKDIQASNIYWQHHKRNRRSTETISDYPAQSSQCRKHNLYISFSEIGWSNWIMYPKGYYLNFCYGICPIPLLSHFNTTNHSIIQNYLSNLDELSVPPVCCTPTQLNPLTIIYSDPITKRYVMKVYLDMQVTACGCL